MRRSRFFRQRRWYVATAAAAALPALAFLPAGSAAASAGPSAAPKPSGSWISQLQWTSQQLASGVTVRSGTLSDASAKPYWTVTIDSTVPSSITGQPADAELGIKSWATRIAAQLSADGYAPQITPVAWPDYTEDPHGLWGYRVRTGDFATEADAAALATTLQGLGFSTATAEWTGYDADQTPDTELVHEAIVNPSAAGIEVTHDGVINKDATTSSVATSLGALVATNGGFFVTTATSGYVGAPAGLAVYNGQLESINSGPRAALVIDHGRPQIADVEASVAVHAGSASYPINGINRIPGTALQCGRPGGTPSAQPRQDVNCSISSELVLFTSDLGAATPGGDGTQVVIGANGKVISAGVQSATDVPAGGYVIQGIGAAGTWLAHHVTVGQRLSVSEKLATTHGQSIPLNPSLSIASAAPLLVQNGRTAIDAVSEGDMVPSDWSFEYAWAEQRQARTIVGINAKGDLLMVTVDGRQPGVSEGATLTEEAALMKSLGAVSAMNLDGGGSTDFTVDGKQVNSPAYATGERLVGGYLVVLPRR
ncbi:MAG TPA: phosphodiester glycosidase family protein [Trebonia sp.]|jgi:exopolysaccharide biosynthesis protein